MLIWEIFNGDQERNKKIITSSEKFLSRFWKFLCGKRKLKAFALRALIHDLNVCVNVLDAEIDCTARRNSIRKFCYQSRHDLIDIRKSYVSYLSQKLTTEIGTSVNKFLRRQSKLPVLVLGVVEVLRCSLFAWGVGKRSNLPPLPSWILK